MRRHPDWLKVRLPKGESYKRIKSMLEDNKLHTVCQEAKCPNIAECFGLGTATFMILGDTCTRNCGYCNVKHSKPEPVDNSEPEHVAKAVKRFGLKYAVVTSVTRDDLPDQGADQFVRTIQEIRELNKNCKVEVLIPDMGGEGELLQRIIDAQPNVLNHNIEVVRKLFPKARPQGNYERSLELLRKVKEINPDMKSKSGLMVGLGETREDITQTLKDLRKSNVQMLTVGQYLQPSKSHLPIAKYYTPEEFDEIKIEAEEMGFEKVVSGPLVRSSYHAGEHS